MRRYLQLAFLLPALMLGTAIASCTPGHLGGSEIAFVRDGHLWTIDSDGANAFEVVASNTPVIGYAWSPDHHLFVFRLLDNTYASTPAGKHIQVNPLLGIPGDLPGSLNTVGLDGGTPIQIISSISGHLHSNAWWNTDGSRLLYREVSAGQPVPIDATWWVSQNDQPDGIARKSLPHSFSIPSFSPDSTMAIGNSGEGIFTTTLAGDDFHILSPGAIPGHPLPASLERLLWQPAHNQPALLYAIQHTPASAQPTPTIDLVLRDANGHLSIIATCACTQFAWSPDGNSILYTTGTTYAIYSLSSGATFSFTAEAGSVPYWSPDSQFLLLDGLHTLALYTLASHRLQLLLSDGTAVTTQTPALPGVQALLQPAPNSLWAADSRHFLMLTRGRTLWQNQALSSGNGLYVVSIDSAGHSQGKPALVDNGSDSQPGWSYEDPNTSFLF
jgi:Tol biopolymer transport system component